MSTSKPLLRGHFHQAMFFVSLGACSLLMLKGETSTELIATAIYSFGVLIMFGVSALYHRINWSSPEIRILMKRFDHCAIYIMIAGTFTPIALLALTDKSSTQLLITIWSVAFLGVCQSIFFVHLPKMVSAAIYVFMGYLIAPYFSEIVPALGMKNIILIIMGGVIYTLGALVYGLKRPRLNPTVFGYHEVFHILVSIGALLHFIVIYSII